MPVDKSFLPVVAPMIIESPQSLQGIVMGDTATFTCTSSGRPEPSITWYRSGTLLELTEKFQISNSTSDGVIVGSTLDITSVTLTDSGTYSCVSSNAGGTTAAVFTLSVSGGQLAHYIWFKHINITIAFIIHPIYYML